MGSLGNAELDGAGKKKFGQLAQKIVPEETSPAVTRRFSSRLRSVPDSERPYYGPPRKNSRTGIEGNEIEPEVSTNRSSSRLRSIPDSKRPYYGPPRKKPRTGIEGNEIVLEVSPKNSVKKEGEKKDVRPENEVDGSKCESVVASSSNAGVGGDSVLTRKEKGFEKWLSGCSSDKDIKRVKNTLRKYNSYFLQFSQKLDENNNKSTSRPDLMAAKKMKDLKEILYPEKRIGPLPGIDVGYKFYSRTQMVAVGLHSHWLWGIDYIGEEYAKLEEFKDYKLPLAVAIVLSGQYEDNVDHSEEVIYTGQGGNDLLGKKKQFKDQKMIRGNLALKNNIEQSVPVRVVRGHKVTGRSMKEFTYDGLYKVVNCETATGASDHVVFQFLLRRLEGQPKLTTDKVHFTGKGGLLKSKAQHLVCSDISEGQEDVHIPVTNSVDDTSIASTGFTYIKHNEVADNVRLPPNAIGCKCKDKCRDPRTCACAKLNGTDFPYVKNRDGGRLIEAKDVVFECGPNCGCGPDCINRVSQQGIRYKLEVFRTSNKGWAVRTNEFIPSGAPVCEYVGKLRRSNELDNVANNDYIFDIDCWQTMNEIGARERRLGDVSASVNNRLVNTDEKQLENAPEFCIDAGSVGNVARFINHSCEPNLFVQCVLNTHHDVRLARVVLFAGDDIPALQELTYDYGYELNSVVDSKGKIKIQTCYCGTAECRGRLY